MYLPVLRQFALALLCVLTTAGARAEPLVIGETFTLASAILGETRRINVYLPAAYTATPATALPVMYMPDGGVAEDFLHVAGLLQVGADNGSMRAFLLVGIENTQRRRDLTGPTDDPQDKTIAPVVGGSAAFRGFIRDELMPEIKRRYRNSGETAIVGESAAGLFVIETFLLMPELFDSYIAIDPSLWWNRGQLIKDAGTVLRARPALKKALYFTSSNAKGMAEAIKPLADTLATTAPAGLRWQYEAMPSESHATIYHPAALAAFRALFRPKP